jgi:large subunit ribosomal protein L6
LHIVTKMAEKKDKGIELSIKLPDKVEAKKESTTLIIKGPKGECRRIINDPLLHVSIKDGNVIVSVEHSIKNEKKRIYSCEEHIKNMVIGVTAGHSYSLKVCAGHFPMTVSVSGNQFVLKNFLGEKFPRTLKLKLGVTVKVEGDKISVTSPDKELAGTVSSDIEKLTRRPGFDTRIFQDGIYLTNKDGKEIK